MATTNGSTAIRDKILASLARYRALRIGKFPCAFWRLSSRPGLTAKAIVNIAHQYFDKTTEVYLFGSRIDDSKKGGDIDLYIIPEHKNNAEQLYNKKIKFLVALQLAIGEQKIDVIIAKDKNRLAGSRYFCESLFWASQPKQAAKT